MSMKSIISLCLLGLAGCGAVSSGNPMAPSVAPSVASCPARFNFEAPETLALWSAPTWPGGFVGMKVDSTHAHCGSQSMLISMDLSGAASRSCQIQQFFSPIQSVSAATRSLWVYFPQTPPAAVRLQVVFVDAGLNWASGTTVKSAFVQGWNLVSGSVTAPSVAGLLLFWDAAGSAYKGQVWVDEINW